MSCASSVDAATRKPGAYECLRVPRCCASFTNADTVCCAFANDRNVFCQCLRARQFICASCAAASGGVCACSCARSSKPRPAIGQVAVRHKAERPLTRSLDYTTDEFSGPYINRCGTRPRDPSLAAWIIPLMSSVVRTLTGAAQGRETPHSQPGLYH